jgi:hypothetical protein
MCRDTQRGGGRIEGPPLEDIGQDHSNPPAPSGFATARQGEQSRVNPQWPSANFIDGEQQGNLDSPRPGAAPGRGRIGMSIVDASVWFDVFNGVSTPEVERSPSPGRNVSGPSKNSHLDAAQVYRTVRQPSQPQQLDSHAIEARARR